MSELVLDKLLNRYLLMSLRANLDNNDSVFKTKQVLLRKKLMLIVSNNICVQIVDLLPKSWLLPGSPEMAKMTMFTRFVSGLGCCQGLSREAVIETARIVRILGDYETGEKLRELLY